MNPNNVLLKTSAATDVLESGNKVTITGLNPIAKNSIVDMKQFKYHAEVVQVLTIGTNTETITAGVRYVVKMENLNVRKGGYTQNEEIFAYTATAADVAGTQAAAREIVNLAIIAQINAQTSTNFMTAATSTGGAGFTVTDSAGYYPPRLGNVTSGRKGASALIFGGGFTSASTITVTTPAVYQFGDGTWLSQNATIFSPYFQNYVSGSYTNPKTIDGADPVAGQYYDAFAISSSVMIPNSVGMMDQLVITTQSQVVFVDNGTGASTTNLTGFIAFEKAMLRLLFSLYERNPNSMVDFFDSIGTFSGSATPAPIGTATATNNMWSGKNFWTYYVQATSTILAPYATTTGLPLSLDATDNEGLELSPPVASNCPKEFVVGKQEFSVYAKINLDDVSGTDAFFTGFRKKEAYAADPNDYNDMATLALIATNGVINMSTIKTNAATVNTSTGITWADGETHDLEVRVLMDGTVKFFVDGADKTSLLASAYTFTAGLTLIPFSSFLNSTDVAVPLLQRIAAIPTASWRI